MFNIYFQVAIYDYRDAIVGHTYRFVQQCFTRGGAIVALNRLEREYVHFDYDYCPVVRDENMKPVNLFFPLDKQTVSQISNQEIPF